MTWNRPAILLLLSLFFMTSCAHVQKSPPANMSAVKLPISNLDSARFIQPANASSQAVAGEDPLLAEIRGLADQRRDDLPLKPGWLHVVTRNAGHEKGLSSLWGPLPDPWYEEEWLDFDNNGNVLRAAKRLLTENLEPLQVSVLSGNSWQNLTLGSESLADEKGVFDPNYGYYPLVLGLSQQGHPISKGTIYKECWYQGEQYSISDGTYKYEAVFNPDRRSLRWLKTWKVSPGPLVLIESKEIMIEERVDQPAAEILALFNESQQISLKSAKP